jgi:hypothetical protein
MPTSLSGVSWPCSTRSGSVGLSKMLDENEFLSPYDIRSLSKFHERHPYVFHAGGQEYRVDYLPAESNSGMFGGNSTGGGRSGCRSTSCSSGRS